MLFCVSKRLICFNIAIMILERMIQISLVKVVLSASLVDKTVIGVLCIESAKKAEPDPSYVSRVQLLYFL